MLKKARVFALCECRLGDGGSVIQWEEDLYNTIRENGQPSKTEWEDGSLLFPIAFRPPISATRLAGFFGCLLLLKPGIVNVIQVFSESVSFLGQNLVA